MHYSIFKAPWLSFFSKDFYSDTALKGQGTGLLYLMLLVFVSNLISTAAGYVHLLVTMDSPEVSEIIAKMPDISIKSGKMSINQPSPYHMNYVNPINAEKMHIIFDTSEQPAKAPEDVNAVLTADGICLGSSGDVIPWNSPTFGKDFDLPNAKAKEFFKTAALAFCLGIGIVILTPVYWISHIFLALIYALVGLVMDRKILEYSAGVVYLARARYATALRMTCVAMTPAIVVTTLLYLALSKPDLWMLFWGLLSVPVSLGYLFFGYNAINEPAN